MILGFVRRRVGEPVMTLLRQGTDPDSLAASLALGAGIGVIPLIGTATLLCTVAALALRLNLVGIQVANYAVYPLQIALILPFMRFGEWMTGHRRFHSR